MTTSNKNRSYVASSPQSTHFKLALDCNHAPIMSVEEVKASYVENRYNGVSNEHVIVCPQCKNHEPGSCQYTPLHKAVAITPMFSRQIEEQEQQQQKKV